MSLGNFITAEEAATLLSVSLNRVYQFAHEGRLIGQQVRGVWFFETKRVREFSKIRRKNGRPKKSA